MSLQTARWNFEKVRQIDVDLEVTQRDQFTNDNININEALIRELVQNSLDATEKGNTTRVQFGWVDLEQEFVKEILQEQLKHAEASGIELTSVNFEQPNALVIEDFGTCGLTGITNRKVKGEEEHFSHFWRKHGVSGKSGGKRGRWGLGKIVFSISSEVGVFFGLTVTNDGLPKFMGQTVLNNHDIGNESFSPHQYFGVKEEITPGDPIIIPLTEEADLEVYKKNFQFKRSSEKGLSVVIPLPKNEITKDELIKAAITNYFYPILTGQLVLMFDDYELNADNALECAKEYANIPDVESLFGFITEVKDALANEDVYSLKEKWIDDEKLGPDDFNESELDTLQKKYDGGLLIGLKLPVTLEKRSSRGEQLKTFFHVFIKKNEALTKGQDIYVRGGLTLPEEAKFRERIALGAMVAEEETISGFLGDAENPAHTKLIASAEKLKAWVAPSPKVKVIKNAVINLYDLFNESSEEEDKTALSKFFYMETPELPEREKKNDQHKTDDLKVDLNKKKKPSALVLGDLSDGFSINVNDEAEEDQFPRAVKVQVAYRTLKGNSFKKYNVKDFDFSKKDIEIDLDPRQVEEFEAYENEIKFIVKKKDLALKVTGFDKNRDIEINFSSLKTEGF